MPEPFRVEIHHYHHLLIGDVPPDLLRPLEKIMGELRDEVAKLEETMATAKAAQDDAFARVEEDVDHFNTTIDGLRTDIATLQARVEQGENDPVLLQRIRDMDARLQEMILAAEAMDPYKPTTMPTDPTGPTDPATPTEPIAPTEPAEPGFPTSPTDPTSPT